MPVRPLPSDPNLEHLKYQAKDLRREHAARDRAAAQRLREFHPRFHRASDGEIFAAKLSLSDAQLAIAREYGFASWPRLKRHLEKPTLADQLNLRHHERIEDPTFRRAVDLMDAGDVAGLRAHLKQHPGLQRQRVLFEGGNYFQNPSLLEFVAENPIRHGTLQPNIVDVARVILEAGVEKSALNETLGLVATGRVPRECKVARPLIDLLCDSGADPLGPLQAAALHGEMDAVDALIGHGAKVGLPLAAALARINDVRRMLPSADPEARHLALALATQHGRVEAVRMLLDAGVDPRRFNPLGAHSHSTPLHQAALNRDTELVRLLVERGADVDLKDILWHGTPADWARHAGHSEVEKYLRAREGKS